MDLIEGLHKAIVGGGRRLDFPAGQSVQDVIRSLEAAAGGDERTRGTRAAAAAGVPGRTWRRWRAGSNEPAAKGWTLLRTAQRRTLLSASREAWLRKRPFVVIDAVVQISTHIEPRVLHVWRWTDSESQPPDHPLEGMVSRTLDDWLARRDVTMQATFMDPISEHLSQEVELVDVHDIRIFRTQKEAQLWGRGRR